MSEATDATIERDPEGLASRSWDLIVVGGGIYGVTLALEAARRGRRPLLVERDDFGGATSWNSLRVVHGGLRYLQGFDLHRFRESVAERRWFLARLPDLVRPQPFLMPLYGRRLRRPGVMRAAALLDDLLSRGRNRGLRDDRRIPAARVLGADEVVQQAPAVVRDDLRGGLLWHDGLLTRPTRVLMELLRWACRHGAGALNYVEARDLLTDGLRVAGVVAVDRVDGGTLELRAPAVVNCAGPWSRELARRWHRDRPSLFRPSLGFNLLLRMEPPSRAALAVSPDRPDPPTWFLLPVRGGCLAGTRHLSREAVDREPSPTGEEISRFLGELEAASPGLGVAEAEVLRVLPGYLPAVASGASEAAHREEIVDHGAGDGPAGLWSVSGVKYTTARRVAGKVLERIDGGGPHGAPDGDGGTPGGDGRPPAADVPTLEEVRRVERDADVADRVRRLAARESVVHLDDLLLRRTGWGWIPSEGRGVAGRVCDALGWEERRREQEIARLDGEPAIG